MRVALLALVLLGAHRAHADGPEDWLAALYARVAADLAQGQPLVVQVHVALCDNTVLRCGNRGLGDGESVTTNLYWATRGGLRGWFGRPGSPWTLVGLERQPRADVLERAVYRRRVAAPPAWRGRGRPAVFDVVVVAEGWRGRAIDRAVEAYVADLASPAARPVRLRDGTVVAGGGAAHVVAYVGHNRWMDRPDFRWESLARAPAGRPKGTIAIACHTLAYLGRPVPAPGRVPLALTADFLFAGSHALEGAVNAVAAGASYAAIRAGITRGYAEGQGQPVGRVRGLFTNPSDPRYRRAVPAS